MTRTEDDVTLVAACRAGKSEAFGALVERYQARLFPTLARITGCAEDAHDLVQDAFLRAFEKLDRFHGESSFYTWIYRIAVNLALSDRRKRRGPGRSPISLSKLEAEPHDDLTTSDPTRSLERAERDALVQIALNSLPEDHRAVVVMKDLDGLRYEQIADILDLPIGTVRSRLHRARCTLRERLRSVVAEESTSQPTSTVA